MGSGHNGAGVVAKQHRQAVGGHYRAGGLAAVVERSIGIGRRFQAACGGNCCIAVNLVEIGHRQRNLSLHQRAVGGNGSGIVANVGADIQAVIRAFAVPAAAGGNQGADIGGRRPVGGKETAVQRGQRQGLVEIAGGRNHGGRLGRAFSGCLSA